jgi:hypothetical protein
VSGLDRLRAEIKAVGKIGVVLITCEQASALVAVVDEAEKALDYAPWLDANERWDSAISALRAAVNTAKEEGHNELENY